MAAWHIPLSPQSINTKHFSTLIGSFFFCFMRPTLAAHSISSTNRTEYKSSVELDAEEQSIPACQAELAGIPHQQQVSK